MIESLEKRLADHKEHFQKLQTSEYKCQRVIDQLPKDFFAENDNVTIYDDSAYFYLYPENIDDAELRIVPIISDLFGPHWSKTVERELVTYRFWHAVEGYYVSFNVTPRVKGTCQIIAVATGKTKRTRKWVDVEEPEVEYKVDCSDLDSGPADPEGN